MLHEYREEIKQLKQSNAHFAKIFDEHNELDQKLENIEKGILFATDTEVNLLKKEKLKLKDEIYMMLQRSKADS
ncbi:hypothetical protein BBW65_02760 [Helicobacter enhydrae]|uniref:DUF465 domain-containing protein n=1 Tax=Helicobacter enhydrae TaxID=222136 RepID=A0A1B1U4W1_9HELI|nr:DUF465 domain-containing protein [Helicobacter enhydrae]ANV97788.1 hypothetical protein BBW65_02760 [Helicobacter enhydrae]